MRGESMGKRRGTGRASVWFVLLCGLGLAGGSALAQDGSMALRLGEPMELEPADGQDVSLTFEATSAGVLSVAVRADGDVALQAYDADGLPLEGGWSDEDLGFDLGAEQIVATVDRAGLVRVVMTAYDAVERATLVASFVAWPAVENRDEDSRPSGAIALAVGGSVVDALDPEAGDASDVFRIEGWGLVVVEVRAEDGDVDLSGYAVGDPTDAGLGGGFLGAVMDVMAGDVGGGVGGDWGMLGPEASPYYSDADLGGDVGHEAFVMMLNRGRPEYVQVGTLDDAATSYTVRCWPALAGLPDGQPVSDGADTPSPKEPQTTGDSPNSPDIAGGRERPPY